MSVKKKPTVKQKAVKKQAQKQPKPVIEEKQPLKKLFPELKSELYAECMFCLEVFLDSAEVEKRSINEKCPECKEMALIRHLTKEDFKKKDETGNVSVSV